MSESVDIYEGEMPHQVWGHMGGHIGGLRQVCPDGEVFDAWTFRKNLFDIEGIGQKIEGNRVIEIGQGDCVLFRDYCIENRASEYVGVDLFEAGSELIMMSDTVVQTVRADMYQFLQKEPADSALIAGFSSLCEDMMWVNYAREKFLVRKIVSAICAEVFRVAFPNEPLLLGAIGGVFEKELPKAGFVNEDDSWMKRV
ncbi:hypothetical protein JKY72_00135 [Candidatus Gracilibacteria bacterium]|nr:hypothetical protein [Candidatus Gracilibacteria bacterium]